MQVLKQLYAIIFPIMKHEIITDIVLVDIINFSTLLPSKQLQIITYLTQTYKKTIYKMLSNSNIPLGSFIVGFVPTGDGFYCILNPKLKGYGILLGLSFNHLSEQISKKYPYFEGLRIAVHHGGVNRFTDILDHKNFIGDGLNDCARYLEFKEFSISTVIVSQSAYEQFKIFIDHHKDFALLLSKTEFKHSRPYTFKDKHKLSKKGYLVWMRKSGIITLPKIDFV